MDLEASADSASPNTRQPGRPATTSAEEIERVAFRLFAERGFEATTMLDIAAAVGVNRRTVFRYYASKNDIPWGHFDRQVDQLRRSLAVTPTDLPVAQAIRLAVLDVNTDEGSADLPHRLRMRLILDTPALQAHAVLRYAGWRSVLAEFVAERRGVPATDPGPQVMAQATLGVALAAYAIWVADEQASLAKVLDACFTELHHLWKE
jgi:mycofactocin system transcriptional regulator